MAFIFWVKYLIMQKPSTQISICLQHRNVLYKNYRGHPSHKPAGQAPVDPAKAQVQSICALALYELIITYKEIINKTQGAFQPVIS